MTDKGLTEIICVIDRSGSMGGILHDAIGGFNQFVKEQQKVTVDRCNLTFVQFDTEYDFVHENLPIQDVPLLTEETYRPRGGTALLDAVGKTIESVGRRYSASSEDSRPGAVVMVILTDGEENSSTEYTVSQIKEMIELQTNDYGWQFVFLGANQDAFAEAGGLGIRAANTANYAKGATMDAFDVVSNSVGTYRSTRSVADLSIKDNISK